MNDLIETSRDGEEGFRQAAVTREPRWVAMTWTDERVELLTPQGDLVNSDTYNKFFTMHGIVMVFFFLIPSIPATLGNFFVPMNT